MGFINIKHKLLKFSIFYRSLTMQQNYTSTVNNFLHQIKNLFILSASITAPH